MILEIKSFQVLVNEYFKNRILAECMELGLFFPSVEFFLKKIFLFKFPKF